MVLRTGQKVAGLLGLDLQHGVRHVSVSGAIRGRPVRLELFSSHCRARATFAEPVLPRKMIVSCEPARRRATSTLLVAEGGGDVPPWLTLPLATCRGVGVTVYDGELSLLRRAPVTVEVCVLALCCAFELAAAIEAARPEANLR